MDEEHSILPSIGTMRVIKAVPSCQRLVQHREPDARNGGRQQVPRRRRRLDASIARPGQRYRAKSDIGAPRPMKMGTIASPWRYDPAAVCALQLVELRRATVLSDADG